MPAPTPIAIEAYASRRINDSQGASSAETTWNIFGATDEVHAYTLLAGASLPALYIMHQGQSAISRTSRSMMSQNMKSVHLSD